MTPITASGNFATLVGVAGPWRSLSVGPVHTSVHTSSTAPSTRSLRGHMVSHDHTQSNMELGNSTWWHLLLALTHVITLFTPLFTPRELRFALGDSAPNFQDAIHCAAQRLCTWYVDAWVSRACFCVVV